MKFSTLYMTCFALFLASAPIVFSQGVRAESAAEKQDYYTCPMHPEVHSEGPGECPICHMRLRKAASLSGAVGPVSKEKKIKFYRNPMDPSITSKVPTKDNMGMDYVPVYEESESGFLSQVPGRSAVSLDETQFQLSGTALVQVSKKDLESLIPVSGRALSSSRVSLQISERDIPQIQPGLEVELESPTTGSKPLLGRISSLDQILDPMTRSLRVDVQLKTAAPGLRQEASVAGSVHIKRLGVLVVPDSAVLYVGQGAYLYVADRSKNLLIPRVVKTGLRSASQIEIIDGIKEGEEISSGPNFLIDSESRIQSSHD